VSILIVDDDFGIRDAITQVLEDEGYRVVGAANGLEAFDHLRVAAAFPCLILLDLAMPVMSGWEFRSKQREDPTLSPIPVVVLSADRGLKDKAASIQADGYLQKPVDIDTLLDTVEQYCG
jgi:CheY-like chemotaxis protein